MAVSVCYAGESSFAPRITTKTSIGEGAHSFTSIDSSVGALFASGKGYSADSSFAGLVSNKRFKGKYSEYSNTVAFAGLRGMGNSGGSLVPSFKSSGKKSEYSHTVCFAGLSATGSAGFAIKPAHQPTEEQLEAWKDWQAEDESHADASYADYKMYQHYKDTLTFEEFQQYKKDAGFGNWKSSDSSSLMAVKMSAKQWKAWKAWQAEDDSHAGVGYAEYKTYQRYKDTLTFEEFQQYKKDAGFGNWKASDSPSLMAVKMSAKQWKAWKAWQAEDESHAGVGYAEYKGYQRHKDTMTFAEYREYMKDLRVNGKYFVSGFNNQVNEGYF